MSKKGNWPRTNRQAGSSTPFSLHPVIFSRFFHTIFTAFSRGRDRHKSRRWLGLQGFFSFFSRKTIKKLFAPLFDL
jgi:hypothetical protein